MSPQDTCDFCGLSEGTETTGELQSTLDGSVVAHHNCMLYSPLVIQKDSQEDTEGFGFDIDSVRSEIVRGQQLRCSYCKKRGATVGCDVRSCKKSYHYPCLIRAKGSPIPHKFIVHCDRHKNLSEAKDSGRLQKTKKRKRLQKATRKLRNKNIRNRHDNDDSERWQRDIKRTKLQNTSGRARNSDIRNQHDDNGDPQTAIMQNMQTGDQQETTFLIGIHAAVEIEDSEEALPSSSGQPMSSGTNSEESESLLNPKVKESFSLSGFPKRKKKYTSNRKPSKQLQEFLQKMTSDEKKELSQIYSELGGSESYPATEMDVTSDNQNGEMTTDNPMNTDVTETSTCLDSSEGDKTPERLPEINVQGIPSAHSSEKEHFTDEQTVSSQAEKIPDRVSKSLAKGQKSLNNVISMLSSTLSSDSDILDRSGMSTLDAAPSSAANKSIRDEPSLECSDLFNVQLAKDLEAQGTSETHPSGHTSLTEPESILCSPLTLEKGGSKSEVSTSISDASVEEMENGLSTSPLSNGEIVPVASSSNVKTLLNEKAQNKRRSSNIASQQQIMAFSKKLGTFTEQFRSIVPQESSEPETGRPPSPKKQAKATKVVEQGEQRKKRQPRRLSSPHLPASKPPSKKKRIVVDEEPLDIHNETLINLVEANPSIWDQSNSSHHDIVKNRKLWDKIICHFDPRYMEKSASSKKKIADAVHTRWRSIRDRFVRDFHNSQTTPSGFGGKQVTPYVHYAQLLFLQKTVSQRSTICSTSAPREAEEPEPSPIEPSQQTGTEDVSGMSEPRSVEKSTVASGVSARLQAQRGRKRASHKNEADDINVDRLQRVEDMCRSELRDLRQEITDLQSRESVYAANEWKLLFLSYVPVAQNIPAHRNFLFRQRLNDLLEEFVGPQEPASSRTRSMDMPAYNPQFRGRGEPSME